MVDRAMSMNLHCDEFDLIQTSTFISCLIYSNNDGKWRGVYYRYKQWVLSRRSVATDKDYYDEHLSDLESIAMLNKLHFTVW